MPEFHCCEEQVDDLVVSILAGGRQARGGNAAPQVVHFEGTRGGEKVFQKQCGACHKALTGKWGGLGKGSIGPNLSGLFSEFYPRTWQQGERWTPEALRKWLANPRAHRAVTQMQPIRLTRDEAERVVAEVRSVP